MDGSMRKIPHFYRIWGAVGAGLDVEWVAVEQMNIAMSLPVTVSGALMPDAHPGYAMPIGGVIALQNAVSPSFVGYDIACRMTMTILDISPAEFMEQREALADDMRAVTSFGVGAGWEEWERRTHPVMDEPLWKEPCVGYLHVKACEQLGSSGGGNHFFDAVIGTVLKNTNWLPLEVGDRFVALITHSGSRGVGHDLADSYIRLAAKETRQVVTGIPSGYEWLDINSDAGREYLQVMGLMGRYAQANHQLIHDLFLKRTKLEQLARYENHHNFAWVQEDGRVIHRKGATPAGLGQVGIIPGSSGTPSYLVEGLGNPESLESSSHGAGRPCSRAEAKRNYDSDFVTEWMKKQNILSFGLAPDEALTAYKDIDRVMELQKDLVCPVAKMSPVVVIMGGGRQR